VRRLRRPAAKTTLALGLAGFTLVASGCTLASPKTITTPYAASDGTNADLTIAGGATVHFRNFLMVSSAKGEPGVLVGAVATDSSTPVPLQLQIVDATGQTVLGSADVTAQPGQLTQIGPVSPDATATPASMQLSAVPVPPGSTLTIHAASGSGGRDFALPVLAPLDQYSTITPTQGGFTVTPTGAGTTASPSAS
jgi:hypothetical protein